MCVWVRVGMEKAKCVCVKAKSCMRDYVCAQLCKINQDPHKYIQASNSDKLLRC